MQDPLTLNQFFTRFYLNKPSIVSGSKATASFYKCELANFERYFLFWLSQAGEPAREPTLHDLSKFHIEGAMAYQLRERGVTRPTANKVRRAMRAIWEYAAEPDFNLGIAPPPKIDKYREPKREPTCWSIDEFGQILFAASELDGMVGSIPRSTWFTALLWLVYNSGLRISAAMATQWDWIDMAERRLVVEPEFRDDDGNMQRVQKDDEGQMVQLLPETVEALRPLLRAGRPPGVFDDWPYDRGCEQWVALNRVLRTCLIDAGLRPDAESVSKRDYFHKIRRVFATYITIESGIETARQMLGHSTVQVTWRYIDKSKLPQKSQADLLPCPRPQALRIVRA